MDKEIVSVEASTFPDGMMLRIAVLWKDGRRFPVEKVLYYSTSPAGEYEGIRYTVLIGSAEKYIYRVKNSWYVMTHAGGGTGEEAHFL